MKNLATDNSLELVSVAGTGSGWGSYRFATCPSIWGS